MMIGVPDVFSWIRNADSAKTAWDALSKKSFRNPFTTKEFASSEHIRVPELLKYIYQGDSNSVGNFLQEHPDVINAKITPFGTTALHVATLAGKVEIGTKLVELMSPEALAIQDVYGRTALHYAANTRMARYMVEKNENLVTIADKWRVVPVVSTSQWARRDMTVYLLSKTPFQLLTGENIGNGSLLLQWTVVSKIIFDEQKSQICFQLRNLEINTVDPLKLDNNGRVLPTSDQKRDAISYTYRLQLNMANAVLPEIQRHDIHNYDYWSACMRSYLLSQDLWDIIKPPPTDQAVAADHEAEYKAWRIKKATALLAIQTSCTPDIFSLISHIDSARIAWYTLFEANLSRKSSFQSASQVTLTLNTKPSTLGAVKPVLHDDYAQYADLVKYVHGGNWHSTRSFLDQHPEVINAKISSSDSTALHMAARAGKVEIVGKLVELMSPEAFGDTGF
ncbi:unnamed protein product [Dovyalis caffra]|uniref:DUF4219 domain-containing protein n=1 Tax=Dovyalis caffra TaxID=77055 RepID=A0AAV1RQY8_9ROSI|nr:unnamed protein product [Dovyalis caffra]